LLGFCHLGLANPIFQEDMITESDKMMYIEKKNKKENVVAVTSNSSAL